MKTAKEEHEANVARVGALIEEQQYDTSDVGEMWGIMVDEFVRDWSTMDAREEKWALMAISMFELLKNDMRQLAQEAGLW